MVFPILSGFLHLISPILAKKRAKPRRAAKLSADIHLDARATLNWAQLSADFHLDVVSPRMQTDALPRWMANLALQHALDKNKNRRVAVMPGVWRYNRGG